MATAERSAEVEDRTRYETGRLSLNERLRAAIGAELRVCCLTGLRLDGRLQRVHPEWLLLEEGGGREALVACSAIVSVTGLGRLSEVGSDSPVRSRLGLRHALRVIARDRSGLRIHLMDASVLEATLDRVGEDFVEAAAHAAGEARRRSEVRQVVTVATAAIVAIRRDG
ncbi:MAG: hypothetical protein ACR2N4_13340 [Jatrophihabitans sp.]